MKGFGPAAAEVVKQATTAAPTRRSGRARLFHGPIWPRLACAATGSNGSPDERASALRGGRRVRPAEHPARQIQMRNGGTSSEPASPAGGNGSGGSVNLRAVDSLQGRAASDTMLPRSSSRTAASVGGDITLAALRATQQEVLARSPLSAYSSGMPRWYARVEALSSLQVRCSGCYPTIRTVRHALSQEKENWE